MTWFVYMLECADGSLYTGVTTALERRLHEHNHTRLGARYTRARRPVRLLYSEMADDRAKACKRESQIKKLPRKKKLALMTSSQQENRFVTTET